MHYLGVDKDVRQYFLNLDQTTLRRVFRAYQHEYGPGKMRYAENTYTKWKSGAVQMSGSVSERLLQLVPPCLSFEQKYELFARIWRRLIPNRTIKLRVTPDDTLNRVVELLHEAIFGISKLSFPVELKNRLTWLSDEDATVAEELLKRVLTAEFTTLSSKLVRDLEGMAGKQATHSNLRIKGTHEISIPGTHVKVIMDRGFFHRLLGGMGL